MSLQKDLIMRCVRLSGDSEIQKICDPYLENDDVWNLSVAMGTFIRLRHVPRDVAREVVGDLLEGNLPPEEFRSPWTWWKGLSEEEGQSLFDNFVSRIDLMYSELEYLSSVYDPNDSIWVEQYIDLLVARDELESAYSILFHLPFREDCKLLMDGIDEESCHLFLRVSLLQEVGSVERLRRASLLDPEVWWGAYYEKREKYDLSCFIGRCV